MTSLSSFVVAFVVSPSLSSFIGSLVAGAVVVLAIKNFKIIIDLI